MALHKSATSHAILDVESRHEKAAKILAVLERHIDIEASNLLDIGTGAGVIAADLAKRARKVTSVDRNDERAVSTGYEFVQVEDETLPFPDASFDVVVYNHVIEHVPDQAKHVQEIARVLRPGGYVYLATPNKYGPADPHYRLPLLSWLPRPLAGRYLWLARRKQWDVYPVSPWGIRRLAAVYFDAHNLTAQIVKYPERYGLELGRITGKVRVLPFWLLRPLQPFVPTQIHLLRRR